MTKIIDYTKQNKSKWTEVVGLCKENDPEETPLLLAKFISPNDALWFAREYEKRVAGFHTLIVR